MSEVQPSDADLVRLCLEGEERGWIALRDRYADLVWGIARHQGLPPDRASDVVQEVFLALLKSLRRLRRRERLFAWIVNTAKRESWRDIRRIRGVERREKKAAKPEATLFGAPGAGLADLELQQTLRQALGEIGERCRRLLQALFATEPGEPYAKIARDLGLAVGSIGAMRQRCLAALRDQLVHLKWPFA